ncbi:MAG: electron transfer flavoprotein subunit beta/FixA family protein [Chloroflexota bacterium]|nr:electron transfer flavoprotein subunit beta/FixA family protein [Chloroflexota bacterium]
MNIVVCIKQVMDPEMPPSKIEVDSEAKRVLGSTGIPPVISPYDRQAVEAALKIKDQGEARITVITVGDESSEDALRYSIAMGADEGIRIGDESFNDSDSHSLAYILTKAIGKIGECDLVLCGRQSADEGMGQVGTLIAENLGMSSVTIVRKVEIIDGKARIERVLSNGYEIIESSLPVLATISGEIGLPRIPGAMRSIMAARKELTTWTAQDIEVDISQVGASANRLEIRQLFKPVRESECEMITGENVKEAAGTLAIKLREAKII